MATDHQTSERVYRALKQDVIEGLFVPGLLNIASLARRYHSSATPVREALLRLVGEGLVELPVNGGFAIPEMTSSALKALYELNERLAVVATYWTGDLSAKIVVGTISKLAPPIDLFFLRLAAATGNRALVDAISRLNDQLLRARLYERHHLPHLDREYIALVDAADTARLRKALHRYHRRRIQQLDRTARMSAVTPPDRAPQA